MLSIVPTQHPLHQCELGIASSSYYLGNFRIEKKLIKNNLTEKYKPDVKETFAGVWVPTSQLVRALFDTNCLQGRLSLVGFLVSIELAGPSIIPT